MRFHGGTGDAELAADAGERLIRGEERQDAGLGWRQGNSLAGLFLFGGFGWLVMVLSRYVAGGRFVIGRSG